MNAAPDSGAGGMSPLQFARARLAHAAALGIIPANYGSLDHGHVMAGFREFNPLYAQAMARGGYQQQTQAQLPQHAAGGPVHSPVQNNGNMNQRMAQLLAALQGQMHSGAIDSGHVIPNRNPNTMQLTELMNNPAYAKKISMPQGGNRNRIRQLAQQVAAGNTQQAPYTYDALGPNPISNMFQANPSVSY